MPFQKGQSGNPNGRPSKGQALADLLDKAWPEADRIDAVKAIAIRAVLGDVEAFKALMNWAYGRPPQALELSGKDGGPIEWNDQAQAAAAAELQAWRQQMSALIPNISSAPLMPPTPATPTESSTTAKDTATATE